MKLMTYLTLLIAPEDSTPPYSTEASPPCPGSVPKLFGHFKAAFWIAAAIALSLILG